MRLMITSMRNEAPFILEWIAYHRLIGFTDFLVYTNDCDDGTDALLERLAELKIVAHVPNPRRGRKAVQWQALSRARNHRLTKRAEWIMVADVDEFLVIHAGDGKLDDLFGTAPQAQGFAIAWRMFGSSGRLRFEPGLVTEQFTRAAPDDMIWPWRATQFKSLFRNDPRLTRLGVHRPQTDDKDEVLAGWVDGSGRPYQMDKGAVAQVDPRRYVVAQINHYSVGSAENFMVKAERGRPNRMHLPIDLGYWVERNFNEIEDHRILRHAPALREAVDALLADPELARLHRKGIAWRAERIAALLADRDSLMRFSWLLQSPTTPVLPKETQILLSKMLCNTQLS